MKHSNSWPVTVSITVLASFFLAMQDPSYRPAFVQVAMLTMLAQNKNERSDDADTDSDSDHREEKEYKAIKPDSMSPDCDEEEDREVNKPEDDRNS